ncbi:MAG TPA: ATP-binding protein [Anaerolineae bacterium]
MNENELPRKVPVTPHDLVDAWLRYSTDPENTLKKRLAHIIVLSEDAIISINESQHITMFNPAAERMFGYQAIEALEQPIDILLPLRFVNAHHAHIEHFIKSPDVIRPMHLRGDIYGLRKDGTEFPAEASISKSDLGGEIMLMVRMRDITERKRSESAMLDALSHTQELYEFSRQSGAARTLNELLHLLLANRHFASCTSAGILVFDHPWVDRSPPPEYARLVASISRDGCVSEPVNPRYKLDMDWLIQSGIRTGPVFVRDALTEPGLLDRAREILTQFGGRSFVLFPLNASGELYGLLVFHFSSPESVGAEDVRHVEGLVDQAAVAIRNIRLFEAEAHARREAEHANEMRLRFLAMISHELRTPLTSIKGFITTLLADDVTWDVQSQREFLNIANQEADKLTDMIDQLLDLSRLEVGMLNIHPVPLTVSAIVAKSMKQLQGITADFFLKVDVPDTLPKVNADPQRIAQVLTNLAGNAAKYSPANTQITISAFPAGSFVQVNVSDQGPGISMEDRPDIFKPFHRGHSIPVRQTKGSGLGLAVCKGLIEVHGGHIWIQDPDSPGTTVSFTLPVADEQPGPR